MKILITGIGNIGKSSLREMVAHKFPDQVIQIDMDYHSHEDIPDGAEELVLVEDVHGLEGEPEQYDRIIYLMPPRNHIVLWIKRGWAWFSSGTVDLSDPKGINKPYAVSNIPIILKIVLKNILLARHWVYDDLRKIRKTLGDKTIIVSSLESGFREIISFLKRETEI